MRVPGYLAGIAVLFFAVLAAQAQTAAPSGDVRAAYDAAFQASLRNPSDPPTLLRYAEAALRVNDLEGAISALERLLLIAGDQPRVKLELGTLYYRLGSYEAARNYFESARASARATIEVKQRSGQYLVDIDNKTGQSHFSGDLLAGLRYSTNANSGPTGSIRAFGNSVIPNPTLSQRGDFSVVGAGNLRHRYDLGRQDSGTLESNLAFYTARQFQVSEANVAVLDLNSGPRMKPFEGWAEKVSLRPFLTGRYVAVHDLTNYWAWGAGVEAAAPLTPRLNATMALFGRRREFVNNTDAPLNTNSSGVEAAGAADLRAELTSTLWLSVGGNVLRYTASVDSESYWEFGVGAAATMRFIDPLGINGRPWQMTANAYTRRAAYDQVNVFVDPATARRQVDVGFGLALAVPLDQNFTLTAQTGYAQRSASISNFSYDAFTSLVGVGWRF